MFNSRQQPATTLAALKHLTMHATEQMEWIIDRERSRAERTGSVFSLVVLAPGFAHDTTADLTTIATFLKRRLRVTDDIGLLGDNQLAVVLPGTTEGGAWKVARDVCRQFTTGREPKCDVYVYPSDQTAGDERLSQREEDDINGDDDGDSISRRLRSGAALDRPAAAPDHLFVKPLPRWKRWVDVLFATALLITTAPILALAMLAIRLSSPGSALFTQRRAGLGGRAFTIYKLRTMYEDSEQRQAALRAASEQDGPAFKIKNDPRITFVGRFLRKSCLDELPQLWNVIRGEMSIVGPRPLPIGESNACQNWEKRRLDVTPGLTCIWQVRGSLRVSFTEWMRMDIRYIRGRSILRDLQLMFQTAIAVVCHRASH